MVTMTSLPQSRPLTVADLADLPDDGRRSELIDGVLVVSPAPRWIHQRALGRLHLLLAPLVPPGCEVLFAPFEVRLGPDTALQPDLLVARVADLTDRHLPTAPLLVVEVLSPSTRLFDLNTKKARFELAGTPSYSVLDPDEPSLVAWQLRDGGYVEVGRAVRAETLQLSTPFPVQITPAELVD